MQEFKEKDIRRFRTKYRIVESGCYIWKGPDHKLDGYGQFFVNGKTQRAHRIAYEMFVGPIPEGMLVLHSCDNHMCVNYKEHLFLGTQQQNIDDMFSKGRANRDGRRVSGDRNGNAKMTWDSVAELRMLYANGDIPQAALGRKYDIPSSQVNEIVHNKSWIVE